jgi:hypothetical protein
MAAAHVETSANPNECCRNSRVKAFSSGTARLCQKYRHHTLGERPVRTGAPTRAGREVVTSSTVCEYRVRCGAKKIVNTSTANRHPLPRRDWRTVAPSAKLPVKPLAAACLRMWGCPRLMYCAASRSGNGRAATTGRRARAFARVDLEVRGSAHSELMRRRRLWLSYWRQQSQRRSTEVHLHCGTPMTDRSSQAASNVNAKRVSSSEHPLCAISSDWDQPISSIETT